MANKEKPLPKPIMNLTLPTKYRRRPYRILYWREASWSFLDQHYQQFFDLEMGTHISHAHLLNPNFLSTPQQLLSSNTNNNNNNPSNWWKSKSEFAINVASDCDVSSHRRLYVNHLMSYLGPERLHLYGRCGNRKLPRDEEGIQIISRYKFFFAFENTIQSGYTTEKLFSILALGIVPVYYGSLDVPNITITPSYIHVKNFKTPKKLAEYLVYLDQHPDEYNKYHQWRNGQHFDPDYLQLVANQVPTTVEMTALRKTYPRESDVILTRRAICCRLCDENFLMKGVQLRSMGKYPLVDAPWSEERIREIFFGGDFEIPKSAKIID
jgi:hypothetical protein